MPGEIEKRSYHFQEAQCQVEYAIFVPKSYSEDRVTPLVVLLHSLFSNPQQVIRYRGVTTEAEKHGFIVVAPFGFNDRGWYGSMGNKTWPLAQDRYADRLGELSERDVLNVLSIVKQEFNIDDKRIYLMGHSMGGAGTLHLGSSYPELWAALVPLSPPVIADADTPRRLKPMQHVPVMIVHGSDDRITPVDPVRKLVATMRSLGMDCQYKEIEGRGHNVPAVSPELMAEVFDFISNCTRVEPAQIIPGSNVASTALQGTDCSDESHRSLNESSSMVQPAKAWTWLTSLFTFFA